MALALAAVLALRAALHAMLILEVKVVVVAIANAQVIADAVAVTKPPLVPYITLSLILY